MKTQIKILIIPILFTLLFSSCLYDVFEEGNGIYVEETREIPDFVEISSSGSFHIFYEYAEVSEVILSGESNLLRYIETAVFNDELKIRTPFNVNIRPHQTIEVYVKGPYVEKIHLSGSGLIYTETINQNQLELSLSGSGKIETTFFGDELYTKVSGSGEIYSYAECEYVETTISGSGKAYLEGFADHSYFRISGSGKIRAYDFPVNDSEVSISGSGDVYLNVEDYLDISISGSGDIHYIGSPHINSSSSGSGRIIDEN